MRLIKKIALTASILLVSLSVSAVAGIQPNNDFSGNGYNDLVWHNYLTGEIKIWEMENEFKKGELGILDSSNTNLVVKAFADFNNDGHPDILLHNAVSGMVRVWLMNGTERVSNSLVLESSNTNLKIIGAGDFSGNGNIDIAVFNQVTGALRIWVMDGALGRLYNITVIASSNTNLSGEAVGDLNADGKPDILLRNNNTGNVRTWLMNGMVRSSNELIANSSNTNIKVRGVLDINADGMDDILWENRANGTVLMWWMHGIVKVGTNIILGSVPDLEWDVGAGDGSFNMADVATDISLNSQTSATLVEKDRDYYKLVLTEETFVSTYTTGELDTYGYLYTASGTLIKQNDDMLNFNFGITAKLQAGTYYIKVRGFSEETEGNYVLHVKSLMPVTVEQTSTTSGHIDPGGVYIYQVEIAERGMLTVQTQSELNTVGYLYDSNFDMVIGIGFGGEGENFLMAELVQAGTYYISVTGASAEVEGDYSLDLKFSALAPIPVALNSSTEGHIDPGGVYFYQVLITENGMLDVQTLGDLNTYGYLYNSDFEAISASCCWGEGENFSLSTLLVPGTYYIRVEGYYGDVEGDYNLELEFTGFSGATIVTPTSSTDGSLESGEEIFYQVEITSAGDLHVWTESELDTLGGIYNSDLELLTSDDESGEGHNFSFELPVNIGTYYIRVREYAGAAGNYTLELHFQ